MKNPLLVPELKELLESGEDEILNDFCSSSHPADAADFVAALDPAEIRELLDRIDPFLAAAIFTHFDVDTQEEVAGGMDRQEAARILAHMSSDDRIEVFRRLTKRQQEAVLPAMGDEDREDMRHLASYEPGTAGAVMNSDYVALRPYFTVDEAITKMRQEAPDKETIYYAYVIDGQGRLIGFVSLKALILASPDRRIESIMHRDVIFVRTSDRREEAAKKISRYDLLALPVVGPDDTLVGIITHDDAIDIIHREHTESFEKHMAITGGYEGLYLKTSAWRHFRRRVSWIAGLAALGFTTGYVIHSYEATIFNLVILTFYIPMLADTGGNAGSQTAAVVIRALTHQEIVPRDALKVFFKEFQVSIMLAAILGAMAFAKVIFLSYGSELPVTHPLYVVAAVIALALGVQVITSTFIGAALPIAAKRLNLDPGIVASPGLTTVVDITGLILYFTLAQVLLGV